MLFVCGGFQYCNIRTYVRPACVLQWWLVVADSGGWWLHSVVVGGCIQWWLVVAYSGGWWLHTVVVGGCIQWWLVVAYSGGWWLHTVETLVSDPQLVQHSLSVISLYSKEHLPLDNT